MFGVYVFPQEKQQMSLYINVFVCKNMGKLYVILVRVGEECSSYGTITDSIQRRGTLHNTMTLHFMTSPVEKKMTSV